MVKRLLLIGFAAAFVAFAQGGMSGGGSGMGGGGGRGGGGGDMGGEGGMGGGMGMGMGHVNHLDQWVKDLKLNKDQRKDIKAILDEGQKQALPLHDQMEKSREAIAETVAAAKGDDEIKASIKKYADLEAQMASLELTCFAKIYKTLDNDQQPKSGEIFAAMSGIFKGKNWNE